MPEEKYVFDQHGFPHRILVQPLFGFDGCFTVLHYALHGEQWDLTLVAGCGNREQADSTVTRIMTNLGVDPKFFN